MDTPTPEQLAKLPKWAQEHIKDLETKRTIGERTWKQFQDEQTPSEVYFEDTVYVEGKSGPQFVRKYIQATGITFIVGKKPHDTIRVSLRYDSPGMIDIAAGWSTLKILPSASNCIRVAVEK